MKNKGEKGITYQIFVEPKGKHLSDQEWKEKFLLQIKEKFKTNIIEKFIETKDHIVLGTKFYSPESENDFKEFLLSEMNPN